MTKIIILILLGLWIWSYVKFKRKMKYYTVMTTYLQKVVDNDPSPENALRLSGALIEIQHYKDAYSILERLLLLCPYHPNTEQMKINLEFCKNPVPGTHQPKNFNHSWCHNFLLVRLGKRRYNFLSEEDYLRTNSIMRQMS